MKFVIALKFGFSLWDRSAGDKKVSMNARKNHIDEKTEK